MTKAEVAEPFPHSEQGGRPVRQGLAVRGTWRERRRRGPQRESGRAPGVGGGGTAVRPHRSRADHAATRRSAETEEPQAGGGEDARTRTPPGGLRTWRARPPAGGGGGSRAGGVGGEGSGALGVGSETLRRPGRLRGAGCCGPAGLPAPAPGWTRPSAGRAWGHVSDSPSGCGWGEEFHAKHKLRL